MGDRTAPRTPMAWQRTLGEMKAHGTMVAQTAVCDCPGKWVEVDLDQLLALYGPDWLLWDRRPKCRSCGAQGHYMASPAPGTPYRPLRTGPSKDLARAVFLQSFGFTRRDIVRIKAMAEATTPHSLPRALNDLDVPFRVGACPIGDERLSNGAVLGEWAGNTLLYWTMHPAERAVWARRPRGPRRI